MGFLSKLFSKKQKVIDTKVPLTTQVDHSFVKPNIPAYQGDYAKAIFLWAHEKISPVRKNENYAKYIIYECGISDPSEYHCELIREGYFEKASIELTLNTLKVTELKQLLSSMNQTSTGNKNSLIERILLNVDEEVLKTISSEELYILSEKGRTFLQEHNDYILLHKHKNWNIDWKEYDSLRKPGYSFYDIVWGIFNKRVLDDNRNFGRNQYHCMYQLLEEEGKRELAIEMLLRVLYIDLSGVCGIDSYKLYKDGIYTQKDVLDHFNVAIMIAPGIINPIHEYKDVYSDDIVDRLYEQKLPVQICDKQLFLTIVHSLLDETYNEITIEKKLKTVYTKFVREL